MSKFPSAVFAAIFLTLGSFFGCDGSGSGTSTGPGTNGSNWSGTWDTSYSRSSKLIGTTAIVVVNAQTSIFPYCTTFNGAPVLNYDTSLSSSDTTPYRIQGNKLLLGGTDTNTLAGGTKIVYRSVYSRSSGSGVIGTWTASIAESLEVVGTSFPIDSIQKLRDHQNHAAVAVAQAGMTEQVTISASSVNIRIHYSNFAQYEAAMLLSAYIDGGSYSVTIQASSPTTIVFTGNVTHEVVTETFLSRTTARYSSSDTAHPPYTTYDSPSDVSQCPANPWFWTFMSANHTSLAAGRLLVHPTSAPIRRKPSGLSAVEIGFR